MEITDLKVKEWLTEIEAAKRREKDYRDKGEKILKIYDGEDNKPFNILYSNTEVIKPSLYSQTPRPSVKHRFRDESPLAGAVVKASQRILEYMVDTNVDGYEKFDESMTAAVQDAALPGRGITRIKFDAEIEDNKVEWATICTDSHKWDRVFFGYATKWTKVPWMCFEEYLDEKEAKELFGAKANKIKYTEHEDDEKDDLEESTKRKTAIFYQIWDKDSKKVIWISPSYDAILDSNDDPMEITGFFPIPKPLQFHKKTTCTIPTALYTFYENQANELNRITKRLNRVIEAIKVRGAYDGNLGPDLEKILDEDDNALVPTENVSFMSDGGFAKHIWLLPLGELVGVAQQLFTAREQCKRVIYEITGISDIIRGQSMASETLGAQKIKEAWGSMRLKNLQKDVQIYVRDTLRIMLDIATQKLPLDLWAKLTGLSYPTDEKRAQAKEQLLQLTAQLKQAGQKPPPRIQQKVQQLQQFVNTPTWEDILNVLKDDYIRSYKIDIETNSTLDVEATEDKELISEFMNAMAQLLNGVGPMLQNGMMPFDAFKSMLLSIAQRFRFGTEVEDEIKSMKPPQPNQEEQKKLEQERKKFEEERRRAGEELDSRYTKLDIEKIKFDFEKRLFEQTKKLAEKSLTADDQMNKETVKAMLDAHKREVQSMFDKQVARLKSANLSTQMQ